MKFTDTEKYLLLDSLWEESRSYKDKKELVQDELIGMTNEIIEREMLEEISDYDLKLTQLDNLYQKIKES